MYDDNRTEYELDVREATNLVIEERIPALAEEIDQLKYPPHTQITLT
jgi:hypothetical protein